MPVSNGQITARHIRETAIRTRHILDEAVVTSKIPDLAVTFPDKIDNPIWTAAVSDHLFQDESLTAYPDTHLYSTTIDVPAWVDSVSAFLVGQFFFTNTSGGDVSGSIAVRLDGETQGGYSSHEVPNNSTTTVTRANGANIIGVAGASIDIGIEVLVQGATITDNAGWIVAILVGHR